MTVETQNSSVVYAGDGSTVSFPVTFPFLADADITVKLKSSSGTVTTWALGTHYTLTGAEGESGGVLTAISAPASGSSLFITREMEITQETDFPVGGPLPTATIEASLDRLTMIAQQIDGVASRSIRVPLTDGLSGDDLELPAAADRASRFLGFDANGVPTPSQYASNAYDAVVTTALASGDILARFSATGDGVTSTVETGVTLTTANRVLVTVGGIHQTEFTISGSAIDFGEGIPLGLEVSGYVLGVTGEDIVQPIVDGQITNAKLADMAQSTIKGRAASSGTGAPVDLTPTQARAILNVEDGADVTDTANVTAAGAVMQGGPATLTLASVDLLSFDTAASAPAYAAGNAYWDDTEKTIAIQTGVGGSTLLVGQKMHIRARNVTGSTILNGSVVYISGATGNRPTVALARSDALATSDVIAVATHDVLNNSDGHFTSFGLVRELNTSAYAEGAALYLSAATAGALTDVAPSSPNYLVHVGHVTVSHVSQGVLLVNIGSPVAQTAATTYAASTLVGRGSAGGTGAAEQIALASPLAMGGTTLTISAATDALSGVVELATTAETALGTDATRAVTPAGITGWTNALTLEATADNADTVAVYDASATAMRKMTLASIVALGGGGGFSNPMTAVGDLIVGGSAGAATRLAAPIKGRQLSSWKNGTLKWGDYYFIPNVPKRNFVTGSAFLSSTSAADNQWYGVCWSAELGLFCAVSSTGSGNRVMTSPDGVTWTTRTSAADNAWRSVCWSAELGLFCAVSLSGTGNRVMTSPDGVTWTSRTSAANDDWVGVCWSAELGLFCAVAYTGSGGRVMTSPDGITWTSRASAASNAWYSVCWSAELGLFCAVAFSGTGNRVMTSPDGITWTSRASAADNEWYGVCWSAELGLFCAVAGTGTGNRVMTSPDGITWTSRASAANNNWNSVYWAAEIGLFCAVSVDGTGNRVMTSPDGITWTIRTSAADNNWRAVCWSAELGLFCAVAETGTGNRVMTSKSAHALTYRS